MGLDPYSTAAGAIIGTAGAWLGGNAADLARRRLQKVAETPGVDIGSVTSESLANVLANLDTSSSIARRSTLANQAVLTDLLNASIPGYSGIQQQRSDLTRSMLAGELPPDVVSAINRRSAARALSGGYSGSGFHDALTARDLGLSSLDLINRGMGYAGNLISSTPRANVLGVENFFGPTPGQTLSLRGHERDQRLALMAQLAGMPGKTGVWGNFLSSVGGALMGTGLSGGFGGGGTTGSSGGSGSAGSSGSSVTWIS